MEQKGILRTVALNSGSNGNCYYVENESDAVLIDAGLSCKETEKRLRALQLSPLKVRAVVISHEHIDHVKGLEMLCKRYAFPVYVTQRTFAGFRADLPPDLIRYFQPGATVSLGNMQIESFAKYHDAAEPCSFLVRQEDAVVGVFTDLGRVCNNLRHALSQCSFAYLEANYCAEMLAGGNYPYMLKKRISGGFGHLSNHEALNLVRNTAAPFLTDLVLSHLSAQNNTPEKVLQLFSAHLPHMNVSIASRFGPGTLTEVYPQRSMPQFSPAAAPVRKRMVQAELF